MNWMRSLATLMLLFPMAQVQLSASAKAEEIATVQGVTLWFAQEPGATQKDTVLREIAQGIEMPSERVLSVTGVGSQSIATSLSQVSLGVMVEAQTAAQAQQQAAQRQTAVIEWLRSQNVSKLETTGISLNPRYDYRNDTQVLRGYEAINTVSFEVETEVAGGVIDGAISAGATRINGVRFSATEDVLSTAHQQALTLAVEDAQQQADTVLAALNLSRQEIIGIVIGSVNSPPTPVARSRPSLAAEDATTPVVGQSQTVTAQVTLEIRY